VSIGFEVDANIESEGSMVEMFHTSIGANTWEFENFLYVLGARSISISGLNDADLEFLSNSGAASEVTNEGSSKSGDAVAVQQPKYIAFVKEIVNNTVGITVQRRASIENRSLG
jgi:hypothetical protein